MTQSRSLKLYQIDAFTRELFAGNPAGVVLEAQVLSSLEMQAIAREMNCSETAFVLPAPTSGADLRIRYFTPTVEVPSCGHATIAAHYIRAKKDGLAHRTSFLTETGAGVLDVEVIPDGADLVVCMKQAIPAFGKVLQEAQLERLVAALGLEHDDIRANAPVQIVSTGHSKVIVPLRSAEALGRIRRTEAALVQLSSEIGCNGYFPFAFLEGRDAMTIGRMFAPAIGISEDPVTGNANGPLGAYLVQHRLVTHDGNRFSFRATQGEHVGRRGSMDVSVDIRKGQPSSVRIYGQAVVALEGECSL